MGRRGTGQVESGVATEIKDSPAPVIGRVCLNVLSVSQDRFLLCYSSM